MSVSTITLPRTLVNQLLRHAQSEPDREICGLISARQKQPCHAYPVANIATHPGSRYAMDPQQQIAALRQIRENGEELFAIYHSHPTAAAAPSWIDIKDANYPEALYLIISLNTKGVLEMRGFYIRDNTTKEVKIEMR